MNSLLSKYIREQKEASITILINVTKPRAEFLIEESDIDSFGNLEVDDIDSWPMAEYHDPDDRVKNIEEQLMILNIMNS